MEEIRLEALRALTILAVHDEQFRRGMWDDLEGTLTRYGFALNDQELEQVRNFVFTVRDSLDEDLFASLTAAYR
ncbi:MAG TPA: hypothetical protein VKA20_11180 [Rubrobacter sp.]|nr:hypothetical protein [Rubrobacter sp.]